MNIKHLLAGAAIAGFLGFGGVQFANAQEDPTTSTVQEDDGTTDDGTTDDGTREDCPLKDGADSSTDGSSTEGSSF